MARIRTIKPEFWADEKLAPLKPIDRLVFLGLISQADDAGRLVDNERLIDGLLFPETKDSSGKSLETLTSLFRIIRYTSESGQKLIQITNWEDHQKVPHPSSYVLPAPELERYSCESREAFENVSCSDQRSTINDHGPTISDQHAREEREAIDRIWAFWRRIFGMENSRLTLTTKRRQKVRARLAKFSAEDIANAIRGHKRDYWWGADVSRSMIETICRSDEQIQKGLLWHEQPRKPDNGRPQRTRDEERQERLIRNIQEAEEADRGASDLQHGDGDDGGGLWDGPEPGEAPHLLEAPWPPE